MGDIFSSEIIKEDTKYNLTLIEDAKISIGGKTEKFIPNINMGKWNDECWLNINHSDVVSSEKETLIDEKIELTIGNNTHKYYVDENGRLEYEIILKEKPISNIIELDLDFPQGLEFIYQPELTQKQIANGYNRPDDVVGSYAVYWNKRNNQYKTGKFCHIYRPELIDFQGKRRWAELEIIGKRLTITCDFKDLVFPVILDPILGYDTVGGSNFGLADYAVMTFSTSDGTGGTLQTFHCCIQAIGGDPEIKMAIYATDGDGDPNGHALIEQILDDSTVTDDFVINSGTNPTILANTTYAICWTAASGDTHFKYDSGSLSRETTSASYPAFFQDPGLLYTLNSISASLWAVYTAAGEILTADSGTFTLIGQDATLLKSSLLNADPGSYSLTGQDAQLLKGHLLTAESGTYLLAGQDAGLLRSSILSAESGSFILSGQDAGLFHGHLITCESGSFLLTGQDADLIRDHLLIAESAAFILTGQDATLIYSGAGDIITAESGSFLVTGQDAQLLKSSLLSAESGTFTFTGFDATLTFSGSALAQGLVRIIGTAKPFTISGTGKLFVVTGTAKPFTISGNDGG